MTFTESAADAAELDYISKPVWCTAIHLSSYNTKQFLMILACRHINGKTAYAEDSSGSHLHSSCTGGPGIHKSTSSTVESPSVSLNWV